VPGAALHWRHNPLIYLADKLRQNASYSHTYSRNFCLKRELNRRRTARDYRKTVCPHVARWLALPCLSERCSGRPSRSSPQEDEPWGMLPIFSWDCDRR
jgi:hypothetical protein